MRHRILTMAAAVIAAGALAGLVGTAPASAAVTHAAKVHPDCILYYCGDD